MSGNDFARFKTRNVGKKIFILSSNQKERERERVI